MSLPKWLEELKQIVEVVDSLNPQEGKMAIEALTIAVEALKKARIAFNASRNRGADQRLMEKYGREDFEMVEEALRRIEELGK